MALVTFLEPSPKERNSVHQTTRCLYTIVKGENNSRYLQVDTLGSDSREFRDKVSQSIQFDRQAAGQLIESILRVFPDLALDDTTEPDQIPDDADDHYAIEGRSTFRLHKIRERDPRLALRKKRAAIAAFGILACEVCSFDFASYYGSLGEGFAECHHRLPLGSLNSTSAAA